MKSRIIASLLVTVAVLAAITSVGTLGAQSQLPPGTAIVPATITSSPAKPSPQQLAWHDYELGMFIHIAPQTWQDSEDDKLTTPLTDINPAQLDTDEWVRVAKSMGAKYIVFVAKHEGGFCWWQTDTTDFGVRNTPWRGGKGDVLADLSASARKAGIKLGVYLSPQDRKHGIAVGGRAKDPAQQADYEKLFRQQLTEVLSKYGEMAEVWFDGNLIFDVGDILAKHAPNAVYFQGPQASIRWVGNENGVAPYPTWNAVQYPAPGVVKWGDFTSKHSVFGGNRWLPIECDARIRSTWFWKTNNAQTLKSVDQLMTMYQQCVGHGGVLLLNQTPDRSGRIPEADAARGAEFGAAIAKRFGTPIAETRGITSELTLKLPAGATVGYAVVMENLAGGEQVQEYVIEVQTANGWQEWVRGTAIGHKKIDAGPATAATAARLRITKSAGPISVRRFAVFAPDPPAK